MRRLLLTCLVLALGATSAIAASSTTVYDVFGATSPDPPQAGEEWGARLVDANVGLGGGGRDLFVGTYNADLPATMHSPPIPGAGQVTLMNTSDRSIRYEIRSPEPQPNANFGFYIANIGDINGDGGDDLAVGQPYGSYTAPGVPCTPPASGCNVSQGKVYVFEGSTGKPLYSINSPDPQGNPADTSGNGSGGFGARIAGAGDVNGDGIPDIIVGAPAYDQPANCSQRVPILPTCHQGEGAAYIFSGKDGSLIRKLTIPPGEQPPASCKCGRFGGTVSSPGDLNGDGVPDQLVAAYSYPSAGGSGYGRMYLLSGKDGSVLARIDPPVPAPFQFFGLQDVAPNTPGDVNGDGVPDIYVSAFNQTGPAGPAQGAAWIFDGKSTVATGVGQVLYTVNNPSPAAQQAWGFSASKTFYDGDGTPDLLVGGIGDNHSAYIYDGGQSDSTGNGVILKALSVPPAAYQFSGNYGWSSRSLGDINGDCVPDYVVSAPDETVNGTLNWGELFFFQSNVPGGSCPASPTGPPPQSPPGPPGPTPPGPTPPPLVTHFGLTNHVFAVGAASTPTVARSARTKHRKGTTFRYTLNEAATARIVIYQRVSGVRRAGRCVAPTRGRHHAHARRCPRFIRRGKLTRSSPAGVNRVVFSGRIGSRALRHGHYRATLTATNAARQSSKHPSVFFSVVKH